MRKRRGHFPRNGNGSVKGLDKALRLYHRHRGGAVKRAENRVLMKQNGYVAYIERDVEKLATDGRPLSAGGAERLKKLFDERDGLYRSVADRCFPVTENPDKCAEEIVKGFGFERKNG